MHSYEKSKIIAEKYLDNLLEQICEKVNLKIADWDLDKNLLKALISSPKTKTVACLNLLASYDECYRLLKSLKIKIDPRYRWFTQITEHIKTTK
jgi:REP element-mobilizing transposase RayT